MVLPKYEIIKQDIIEKIITGEFEIGTKIYSEGELKRIYHVSNTTVVRALQDLVLEGYLIRRQGEGTYVRRNLRHKKVYLDELGPFIKSKSEETVKEAAEKTITKFYRSVLQKEIAKKLNLKEDESLTQIVQIAMIDDLIWKIQIRYVSDEMLTDDMIVQLQSGGSLSEEYKKKNQLNYLPMHQEVKFSVVANESDVLNLIPEEMLYVDWALNLPIVKFNKTYFDNHKKAIEFSTTLIHYKHYAIKIEYEGI
ncbi:GntR family transcriptional regulator [Enterococcus faecalis]|uniref:GntR family transcriptional regulator n=1 Tax=Enterococcus faecalis TaxID=1351 RepID=UPI002DB7D609|nr:GntR family transcriptional regulator [Enterococcus faecalis]MEB7776228.1 GntR family transcriptional regulator [Enterococcus faecalis]